MCKIKIGKDITQIHEVQNLITAYILSSKVPYTISQISKKIMRSCLESNLIITEEQIKEMVIDTTIALLRAKYITSNSGYYYALPIASI